MTTHSLIDKILDLKVFAVTGVSRDPEKYGYVVYRKLKSAGYTVYAVNPNSDSIDNDPCYPGLDNLPGIVDCVVTVTPPEITESSMLGAGRLKIRYVWMQPGSESASACNQARAQGLQVVSGGPCILVSITQRQDRHGHTD